MRSKVENPQEIVITAKLNESQAWLYAQFLKRVRRDHYRALAMSEEEAYIMHAAGELIRDALREKGFAPH